MLPATSIVKQGQRLAESLMKEKVTITRVVWHRTEDGFDEKSVEEVYSGPGKVQTFEPYEQVGESAGATIIVQRYRVDVPVSAGPFHVGDIVTVDGYAHPFRIAGLHHKSYQTAQRLLVDEEASDEYRP